METFPLFLSFPGELQDLIWELSAENPPRLAIIRFRPPPAQAGAYTIRNPTDLAQTNPLAHLLVTCARSHAAALRVANARGLDRLWLRRLSLNRFAFDPAAGVVYFHEDDQNLTLSEAIRTVLGNEIPNMLLSADMFLTSTLTSLSVPGPVPGPGPGPVVQALGFLRSQPNALSLAFQDRADGLQNPRLPSNLILFLGSPANDIRFEDLQILPDAQVTRNWILPNTVEPELGAAWARVYFARILLACWHHSFPDLPLPNLYWARFR